MVSGPQESPNTHSSSGNSNAVQSMRSLNMVSFKPTLKHSRDQRERKMQVVFRNRKVLLGGTQPNYLLRRKLLAA